MPIGDILKKESLLAASTPVQRALEGLNMNKFANAMQTRTAADFFPKIASDAERVFEGLQAYIAVFESELDVDKEVGAIIASFGSIVMIHVKSIGYTAPSLITFHGIDGDGNNIQLIQHVTQLNFMLKAVAKIEEKPYRVGFTCP